MNFLKALQFIVFTWPVIGYSTTRALDFSVEELEEADVYNLTSDEDCSLFAGKWQGYCSYDDQKPIKAWMEISVIGPNCQGLNISDPWFHRGVYYFGGMQKEGSFGGLGSIRETTIFTDRVSKDFPQIRREVREFYRAPDNESGYSVSFGKKVTVIEFDFEGRGVTVIEYIHSDADDGHKPSSRDSQMRCSYSPR